MSTPGNRLAVIGFVLLTLAGGALAGAYFLSPRLERDAPQIALAPEADVLGLAPIEIRVADPGAGLKSFAATLSVGGSELVLASEQYAEPVKEKRIALIASNLKGVKEGPAVLRITATDGSLWNFGGGNVGVLRKNLTIDVTPPTLELLADDRYVNFGGVGAIVYKASADTATSGVRVGAHFFPGLKGPVKGHPDHFMVLFAHSYDVPPELKAVLVATDRAGNTREMSLAYELKEVKFRKSTIALPDAYLQGKVAPLLNDSAARQGAPRDLFVAVNTRLRKENEDRIAAVTRKTTPSVLWSGAFRQLSNSKVEANFADHRTYTYNGEAIDTSHHLGYDLSVTKRYPVEAANGGTVAFAGDLGIYGNTVILDHGLGLFTLYAHLSAIDVKEGDAIKQLHILGRTGETGLAAGDHLHYGVYLHGVAVLPVEWWDPKWIDDNIRPKLDGLSGEAIAESQQPKVQARGTRKRRR